MTNEALADALEREMYGRTDPHGVDVRAAAAEATEIAREVGLTRWAQELRARGWRVETRNQGVLIIARQGHRRFDIWPSTGRWSERDNIMDRGQMAWNRPAKQAGVGLAAWISAAGGAQ